MIYRLLSLFVVLCVAQPLLGETFLLENGGTITGTLLNADEISKKTYRIKTDAGLIVTLDTKLVKKIETRQREALIQYEAESPFIENTLDEHKKWAKWCSENQLPQQAKYHWNRILELDTDNDEARKILDYMKDPNVGWISRTAKLENRGLIKDSGKWKTSQQIEVEKILDEQKKNIRHYDKLIADVRKKNSKDKENLTQELLSLTDPLASEPLAEAVRDEKNPEKRRILILAMANLGNAKAMIFLADQSLRLGETQENQQLCLDELQNHLEQNPQLKSAVVSAFARNLRPDRPPHVINAAAKVIDELKGYEAIPALIDTVVTDHKEVSVVDVQGTKFGSGGGTTYGQGQKKIEKKYTSENQAVLTALMNLTNMNYAFNKERWREWYRQSLRSADFNPRRS